MADHTYHVENPEAGQRRTERLVKSRAPVASFQVPAAPHRPGDEPRFSKFSHQPGDLPQPDLLAPYEALNDHAHGLIRVLDDDGHASGEWDPQLGADVLRAGLEQMLRVRLFDSRMLSLQRQGRLSFYVECKGEEAVAVAAGMALPANDLLFPAYRQQGLFLVRGATLKQLTCQCIGNGAEEGKGRQMPVHYSHRDGNLVSISSPVGTQFPQAVGAAMAAAYRGDRQTVLAWMGEGTAAVGDFHYALNFASVYLPPVVLNVVNNQWAISTHRNLATGGKTFATRGESYRIPGLRVDGNDFLAVYAVTQWAAERARRGGGPTLIELLTYRAGAHSSSDDPNRYRPADEARLWPGGDPIQRLADHLTQCGEWSNDQYESLRAELEEQIQAEIRSAEADGSYAELPLAAPETIFEDVYAELPPHLREQRDQISEGHDEDANPSIVKLPSNAAPSLKRAG